MKKTYKIITWLFAVIALCCLIVGITFTVLANQNGKTVSAVKNVQSAESGIYGSVGNDVMVNENTVTLPANPVAIKAANEYLYAACENNTFYVYEGTEERFSYEFNGLAIDIAGSNDGNTVGVLVQNRKKNRLLIFDVDAGSVETVSIDSKGRNVVYMEEEQTFHVCKSDIEIVAISKSGEIVRSCNLPDLSYEVEVYGNRLLFLGEDGVLREVNPATYEVVRMINVGTYDVMAVYGNNVYLSSYQGTLAVLDLINEKLQEAEGTKEVVQMATDAEGFVQITAQGECVRFAHEYIYDSIVYKWVGIVAFIVTVIFLILTIIFVVIYSRKGREIFLCSVNTVKKNKFPIIVLVPAMVLVGIFCYYPALSGFFLSFMDYKPGVYSRFVGFENFAKVFTNVRYWSGYKNLLILAGTGILKALIPPILVALMLFAIRSSKVQYVSRILLYLPAILPGVAGLLLWKDGIYGTNGLLNSVFGTVGKNWLADPKTVIWWIAAIGFPWVGSFLIFFGAFSGIPNDYREAAILEGCPYWKRIISVEIPLIFPQIRYVFLMSFISSVQEFNLIFVLLGKDPNPNNYVPMLEIYNQIGYGNFGIASAMGIIMFIMVFGATFFSFSSRQKNDEI